MKLLLSFILVIITSTTIAGTVSYQVVRDTGGDIICFGPNDGQYVPTVREGDILTIFNVTEGEAINFNYADLMDNYVLDYVSKQGEQSCQSELDCDAAFASFTCQTGEAIKNYKTLSLYCAVDVMKIDGKKLVNNPAKKAAYDLAEAAKIEALRLDEIKRREFVFKGTTSATLKTELNEYLRLIKD